MLQPLEVISRFPPHDGSLPSMLDTRVGVQPEREFLVYGDRSWSYREVKEAVERASALYAARGVEQGDRVGLMSQNHVSTVITLFALARLGAVLVPLNPDYGVAEAAYVLGHAQVSGVVCAPQAIDVVRGACKEAAMEPWLLANEAVAGLPNFWDELAASDADGPAVRGDADATCLFIYTSGTTGFPKGVMHRQRSVVLAGEGFVQRMFVQPDERLLCILPMFHINALLYSLSGTLAAGATIILEPRFSASSFWSRVAESGATEVNTIAAVSNILMRRPRSEFVPGHPLRKVYGGPYNDEVYRVFQGEFGVPHIIEGYAMSEIPGVLNNPFDGERRVGSMGKPSRHPDPRITLSQARVLRDDGSECDARETGELVVKTPIVMQGYYRDREQTAAAFRDGWFMTGDLAWRDEDGYFWFVARKKDIIRKRGENISGAELDRVIASHPSVLDAAAIPVASDLGEDDILVAIVTKEGAELDADTIAQWCRERLAPIKVPRYVVFVDRLPRTPTHRVEKYKLRSDQSLRERAIDLDGKRS